MVTWLADCLSPDKFDIAVKAVKELCGFAQVTDKYKTPSLALKLGHSLKKCCTVAICSSIKANDGKKCHYKISCTCAIKPTLTSNKMNKPQMISLTSDIQKLNQYIAAESKKCRGVSITTPF